MYKFQVGHNVEITTKWSVLMEKPYICKENVRDIEFGKPGITGRIVNVERYHKDKPFIVVMDNESGNFYGTYYTGAYELVKISSRRI